MVFSSPLFLYVFLPAVLILYHLAPVRARNGVLIAASLLFYTWGAPRFVAVLLGQCLLDYVMGHLAAAASGRPQQARKRWLILALVLNLGLLGYFKYANFFVAEFTHLLVMIGFDPGTWTSIALPIGISFMTFHQVSYLVDVYRGATSPARNFGTFLLYVVLFPQLIAGPIIRYHEIADQLVRRVCSTDDFLHGLWRFSLGLGKKVLIANPLAFTADRAFALPPDALPPGYAWVGIVCYAFQLYFDFSGYSDMAIGLARMFGFKFPENFNHPYTAHNFTEFWRRWHMTLSHWMREYLYIPLGGNRRGPVRGMLNLWIVFFLSGLWHGAAWNFMLWGLYHGFFLSLDKLTERSRLARTPHLVAVPVTFILILFGWVLFRADTLTHAGTYFQSLFGLTSLNPNRPWLPWIEFLPTVQRATLAIAASLVFIRAPRPPTLASQWLPRFVISLILVALSACALASGQFNPFIYFRF